MTRYFLLVNHYKVEFSGLNEVIWLYHKIPDTLMPLICNESFCFVHITFINIDKFLSFAQFPLSHFFQPVVPSLRFLFSPFILPTNLIYCFVIITTLTVFHCSLGDSKSLQGFRTLLSILTDLNNAVVSTFLISYFPRFLKAFGDRSECTNYNGVDRQSHVSRLF